MSDASVKLMFTKCQSEAEIREVSKQWKESEKYCTNPHKDYIEIKDIPSKLKPQLKILKTLLELIAKLTVRIKIPIESKPPSIVRESVFGTGFIQRVRRQWVKTKEYGVITVSTVHHVLSPDSAKGKTIDYENATIKINFDSADAEVKRATGFTILESDKDINTYDWCSFECTTEDLELIDTLSEHISSLEVEQKNAYKFYKASQKAPTTSDVHKNDDSSEEKSSSADFVAVISHPHGGPKKVSFGKSGAPKEILKQVRDQQEWCCYFHDALTCSGSSGSPVFIFGQPLCGYGYWFGHPHNHSGKRDDGLKVTSIGVDHIETTLRP